MVHIIGNVSSPALLKLFKSWKSTEVCSKVSKTRNLIYTHDP